MSYGLFLFPVCQSVSGCHSELEQQQKRTATVSLTSESLVGSAQGLLTKRYRKKEQDAGGSGERKQKRDLEKREAEAERREVEEAKAQRLAHQEIDKINQANSLEDLNRVWGNISDRAKMQAEIKDAYQTRLREAEAERRELEAAKAQRLAQQEIDKINQANSLEDLNRVWGNISDTTGWYWVDWSVALGGFPPKIQAKMQADMQGAYETRLKNFDKEVMEIIVKRTIPQKYIKPTSLYLSEKRLIIIIPKAAEMGLLRSRIQREVFGLSDADLSRQDQELILIRGQHYHKAASAQDTLVRKFYNLEARDSRPVTVYATLRQRKQEKFDI